MTGSGGEVDVGRPTGTRTFLFTDVVGSTDLWARHPGLMAEALARHDRLVRAAIEGAGGRVFSTAGDAFHAVFDGADAAVAAARAVHASVDAETWPPEAAIAVRAALHTGEALERDGDFFGSTLNRVARLVGLAAGGQTVCSAATARVLADRPAGGVTPRRLGAARLKGLPGTEDVHGLVVDGAPDTFEPIAPDGGRTGNLGAPATALVGRDAELATLAGRLRRSRVVTLTGTGGVGKTSLARAAAHEAVAAFPGGAWWVDLAEVGLDADLAALLAGVLAIRGQADVDALGSVVRALADDRPLVVLDNCEHVLAPVARLVEALVAHCPGVVVLATSRRRLGVAGEHEVAVRPLRCDGPHSEAVAMLRLRVGAAAEAWPATERDAAHELARRLDGLPLALELAARRCRAMHPSDVLGRLTDRFRALGGGDDGRATLRGTVRWSFDLLGPAAQRVLRRLAVITGAFSIRTAEAVGADDGLDAFDVDDALVELVECGLLDAAGGRYQMLETTREFAIELLPAAEREATLDRQASWVLDLVDAAHTGLRGPDELLWVDRLDADWASVRAAYHRLTARSDGPALQRLLLALDHHAWFRRTEALAWTIDAGERFGGALPSLAGAAAFATWVIGAPPDEVLERGTRAQAAYEQAGGRARYDDGQAESAIIAGLLYGGRPLEAVPVARVREGLAPDGYGRIFSITSACLAYAMAMRAPEGRADFERARAIAEGIGNPTATAWVKLNECYTLFGQPALAAAAAEELIDLAQAARNPFVELNARQIWASVAGAVGATHDELLRALVDTGRELVRAGWIVTCWRDVAQIAVEFARAGDLERALLAGFATRRSPWGAAAPWLETSLERWSAGLDADTVERLRSRAERLDAAGVLAAVAP